MYAVAASSLTMVWQVAKIQLHHHLCIASQTLVSLPLKHAPIYCFEFQVGIRFKFRYASTRDIGISVYLVLVVVFFYNQLPLEIIKPVFFADPLGALVGRQLTESGLWNPAWTGKKIFFYYYLLLG